ncbi:hypothetical protein BJF90_24260 [Pseudonocardia sp. CNS-004]|nr:hypothetical protein BJF90_24260 [Pseudonocardia sp. CNS-004]
MPYAKADGVEIFYDEAGDAGAPAVVLIAGGGAQLIAWHDDLVALLVAEGLRVVRIDNRDTGFSQRFGGPRTSTAATTSRTWVPTSCACSTPSVCRRATSWATRWAR